MTAPDGPVVYAEPGSTWWPLLWGPAFAGVGALFEVLTGPVHVAAWLAVAVGLAGMTAAWVNARRKVCSVTLTRLSLRQGQETLAVEQIAEVADVGAPVGARVLGGGWSAPRKLTEVPIKLADGTVVLGWARDGEALTSALATLIGQRE